MKRTVIVAAALLLTAGLALAQLPKPENIVQLRAEPAQLKAKPGGAVAVTLLATIEPGFHINSNKPSEEYLIPTRVELLEPAAFTLDKVEYPAGELKTFGFAPDEKLSVYAGTIKVPLRLKAKRDAAPGENTVRLTFQFQACNEQICLRPARREVALKVLLQ